MNWKHIDLATLEKLRPCRDRLNHYKDNYIDFSGDIVEFLSLDRITPEDKIWVAGRVIPRNILEIFAVDCAVSAAYAYAAVDAAYAYAAVDAAYAAYDASARKQARENQIDALIMLIEGDTDDQ